MGLTIARAFVNKKTHKLSNFLGRLILIQSLRLQALFFLIKLNLT